jgi:hypothetical protein
MPHQRDHIVSSMVIHLDEQLPIKEGDADLEYYYDSVSIILSAGYDECAVDRPQRNQKAPWWKWFGCSQILRLGSDTEFSVRSRPNYLDQ